jgi:2-dehydropantoate 2-reductase
MTTKTRIAILGTGGVGGYFGGLLAEKYRGSNNVEIIFITRPGTEKGLRENGLKLITPQYEKTIFPDVVSSDPAKTGKLDYLICTTKSYDLEESLIPLKDCVTENTVILPLLNGVDAKERISKIFPLAEILEGCVYIVSQLVEPGVVRVSGNISTLHFGSDSSPAGKLKPLEKIFSEAGIECFLSEDIRKTIWEKFLFISSIASLTSYLNLSLGDILANDAHRQTLLALMRELKSISDAKNIGLQDDIVEKLLAKMQKLPYSTTSSMHRDFQKGGRTEYISLTAYAVKHGKELAIATPEFDKILHGFMERQKSAAENN